MSITGGVLLNVLFRLIVTREYVLRFVDDDLLDLGAVWASEVTLIVLIFTIMWSKQRRIPLVSLRLLYTQTILCRPIFSYSAHKRVVHFSHHGLAQKRRPSHDRRSRHITRRGPNATVTSFRVDIVAVGTVARNDSFLGSFVGLVQIRIHGDSRNINKIEIKTQISVLNHKKHKECLYQQCKRQMTQPEAAILD